MGETKTPHCVQVQQTKEGLKVWPIFIKKPNCKLVEIGSTEWYRLFGRNKGSNNDISKTTW